MHCGCVAAGLPQQVLAAAHWQNFLTIAAFSTFLGKITFHITTGNVAVSTEKHSIEPIYVAILQDHQLMHW